VPLTGKSHIHFLSWNKYTFINFLTHEDIKLINYDPRTNISFNNFQVMDHVGLKDNLCSTKGFYGQIFCQYSTLIMNKSLTNIITNPKTQILIKKTQTLNYTKKF